MNENDQSTQDILQQAQENLSESAVEAPAGDPVSGSDTNNAASDAVTDDPYTSGSYYTSDEEVVTGTVEDSSMMEEIQVKDISFNVALLFIISMLVGLEIFSLLSRKWHA